MKKILLIALAALFAWTASAQNNNYRNAANYRTGTANRMGSDYRSAVGPRVNFYTNTDDASVGIGAYYRYSFNEHWRIEPSLTALLHSGCSIDISVDAQYLFHLGEGWSVYPAVGFTANDIGKWAAGLNIGGGFDFEVARNWNLSAGLKWQPMFDDWRKNPVVISIGAAYKF